MVASDGHEVAEHVVRNITASIVLFPCAALVVIYATPQVVHAKIMGFLASNLAGLAAGALTGIEVKSVCHDVPLPLFLDADGHDDGAFLVGNELQGTVVFFDLDKRTGP